MPDDKGAMPTAETDKGTPAPAGAGGGDEGPPTPKVLSRQELDDYRESLRRRFHSV